MHVYQFKYKVIIDRNIIYSKKKKKVETSVWCLVTFTSGQYIISLKHYVTYASPGRFGDWRCYPLSIRQAQCGFFQWPHIFQYYPSTCLHNDYIRSSILQWKLLNGYLICEYSKYLFWSSFATVNKLEVTVGMTMYMKTVHRLDVHGH